MKTLKYSEVQEVIRLADACYPPSEQVQALELGSINAELLLQVRPEEEALTQRLRSLEDGALVELCALMWLGRGAGGEQASDWEALVADAELQNDKYMASYIAEKAPLAEYLRDGLAELGHPSF
ncbi:DUF3775 domain-containing protein [Haliea sp. E1-2-M8]|uniref:DUF3775 domain-containing protein n=1 Tax=Haliea sp. E1-2-M8 TaxID=3064706 RepID=UPI00271FC93E|nr:DUF3775 domain-containing protein [Haliea sp. E1-2-M8]MDO8864197.1 DUF3775 domain-containing protein [Haliea sp. E1-2-M8]